MKFGNTTVTIAYTQEWAECPAASFVGVAPIPFKSLKTSIEVYSPFATLPPEVVIITGVDEGPVDTEMNFPIFPGQVVSRPWAEDLVW
jgi:hypothetical protein